MPASRLPLAVSCLLPLALAAVEPVVVPPPDASAGGWADGGPLGSYFANPTWAGEPAFTRRDVRVDFDWGERLPVGGSPAGAYRSFPRDRFSVRWAGRVVPRFSEAYVFFVAADGARLRLRPEGAAAWTIAVDRLGQPGQANSQPVKLTAGRPLAVELDYLEDTGPAAVRLAWSCPSVPEQVIDPVAAQGLNAATWNGHCWADEVKTSRFLKGTQDGLGQASSDVELFAGEGRNGNDGVYELSFQGQAEVMCRDRVFTAGGRTWRETVPRGAGWEAASNTTRLSLVNAQIDDGWGIHLTKTSRQGNAVSGDGVTGLRLMRPLQRGAQTTHHLDEIVNRPFKVALAPFTCLRWLQVANVKNDGLWGNRTLPGQREFSRGGIYSDGNGGECWEYLVTLANECGKDLAICLPMLADDAYIEQLARLLRFGSDGTRPYDQEVDDPRWPPLNPNLRLYVEIGNEIWNWSFGSSKDCNERARAEIKAQTDEGRIINYDGYGDYRRWHALRTVRASDLFRRVNGDAQMGSRIRLLMEYQYANYQETASRSFNFLDAWFNNGDGDHVATPHPIAHWIWGAGGATYYGVGNNDGHQKSVALADAGFEAGFVPAGSEAGAPAGSGWTCTGAAAIYRNWEVSISSFLPGTPGPVKQVAAAGHAFTVERPLVVQALGCWLRARVGAHSLTLMGPQGPLAQVAVKPQLIAVSEVDSWVWGPVAGSAVQLQPGVTYHLLARADKGAPNLFPVPVEVSAGPGFTIKGAVRVVATSSPDPKTWSIDTVTPGAVSFGPVAVRASAWHEVKPTGLPEPPHGGQAAVLRAGGTLSTTVAFAKAGRYALELHLAGPGKAWPGHQPFTVTVGGKPANPRRQRDERVIDGPFNFGGFHRRSENFDEVWGSGVFSIDQPGEVALVITADPTARTALWTVIDEIAVVSVEALLDSGFGAGQANGQVMQAKYADQLDSQAGYALSFGLPVVAYEAGWSLGGDHHAKPIHTWAKFKEEGALALNDAAEDIFRRSGGFMNVWGVYDYWPPHDLAQASTYPLWRSIAGLASRLPAEAANGPLAPCRLEPKDIVRWAHGDSGFTGVFSKRGEWRSWLVRTPASGVWTIAVLCQGDGAWDLEADGVRLGSGAAGAAPLPVRLVPGLHGIRLRARGPFALEAITVAAAP